MKNIIFISAFFLSISCSKEKDEIIFTITNKSLFYFNGYNVELGDYPIQYENTIDLLKARNIVEYKLKNNSNKNVLFLMNPYQFNISTNLFKSEKRSSENLFFIINDQDENSINIHSGNYNLKNWDLIELLKNRQNDFYLKKNTEIDSMFRKRDALYNSFILKAGETKIFSVRLDLPIIEQPFIENYLDYLAILLTKEEYLFQIYYNMSQDEIEKLLKKEELEYFKNNNLEVFSGELLSNKVRVVPVK